MDVILVCTLTENPVQHENIQEKEEYIKNLPFVRQCNYADPKPKKEEESKKEEKTLESKATPEKPNNSTALVVTKEQL